VKKLTSLFVLTTLALPLAAIHAQNSGKAEPRFTLTLSMGRRDGTMAPYQQVLLVTLTNTSNEVINENWCLAFRGMYDLKVVYNGVPVEDTDAQTKYKKFRQAGRCSGSVVGGPINPGKSKEDYIYYDTTKPGTYEFTVTLETFPWNPEKSVTAQSNTITIIVPEPGAVAPQ
jgi:hypothetical protein